MVDALPAEVAKLLRWDIASNAEKAASLAKMIGEIVIYYAMVEHWLDGMVLCVHSLIPGAKEIERRHPFSAAGEKEFLAESLASLPELARFKDEGLALLEKLDPIGKYRNRIIHGHIRRHDFSEGWIEFSRIVPSAQKQPVRETLTTTVEGLYNKGIELRDLIPEFREFMQSLLVAFDPTYPVK